MGSGGGWRDGEEETERAKTGARRVSSPFSHDRFLALIMLIFLWSARAKNLCLTAERTSVFFIKLALMLTGEKENDF